MKIKVKKLAYNAQLPKRSTEKAGAWDVFCTEVERIQEDEYICHTGLSMTPPQGHRICLVPRSSLTKHRWVLGNHFGIGDEDYTGEYQLRFRGIPKYVDLVGYSDSSHFQEGSNYKLDYDCFPYKVGDRIGQIFLEEVIPIEFEEVSELKDSVRGEGGFGSTGN